jgi:hypothetical protein
VRNKALQIVLGASTQESKHKNESVVVGKHKNESVAVGKDKNESVAVGKTRLGEHK